jgi:hypothetical protein
MPDPGISTGAGLQRSPGQPLDAATRDFFEPRFGHDFSAVRVHADASAARSARDLNAYAYTVGHDIVFAEGRFAPRTPEGRRLIAHELAHVVQQAGVGSEPKLMKKGFESTVSICHRVLESRKFEVASGGVRAVLLVKELDRSIPNCRDFDFGVTLTRSEDWWPDAEIGTCEAKTGGARSFSFGNLEAGTYYLTFWRTFDHPYCCLEGDLLVFDEAISSDSPGCTRNEQLSAMEIVHGALDLAGFIPVLGAIPDGVNAAIYVAEGDWEAAGLSAVAMVPAWGDGVKLGTMAGKSAIKISEKAAVRLGEEGIAKGLKEVKAVSKAEKAATETTEGITKAAAEAEGGLGKEAARVEKREARQAAEAEKPTTREAEKADDKGGRKKEEKKQRTCATDFPAVRTCDSLPVGYLYPSIGAALTALKALTGEKNLRLEKTETAFKGPCPGQGTHTKVRRDGGYVATIVCCPCCKHTSAGPVIITRCRIV